MGAYSNVEITPGVGAPINAFLKGNGSYDQIFREARAQSVDTNIWNIATTAVTEQVAANVNRVGLFVVVDFTATARVYFRFDNVAPTASTYHFYLDPGDRWEVMPQACQLPLSMIGATAGGVVISTSLLAS